MSKELSDYIMGLKEKDGVNILLNAKQESRLQRCWYKDTASYQTFKQCVDFYRAEIKKGYHPTIDQLRFIFVEYKLYCAGAI